MDTIGDDIQVTALSKIGEKSLFTKELEVALDQKKVDFVVHSLKDLPSTLPEGLTIAAVLLRENPQDAVVLRQDHHARCKTIQEAGNTWTLANLPEGAVVGTSSLRRAAQLKRHYPHLLFKDVRGNLNSRLRKLDDANSPYDALILATAGLLRLGWQDRISIILPTADCLYAVGQGALAVECRSDDVETCNLLRGLVDPDTTLCCVAERALLKYLEGGCSVPCAVSTCIQEHTLSMKAGVYSLDGSQAVEDCIEVNLLPVEPVENEYQLDSDYVSIHHQHLNRTMLDAAVQAGITLAKKLEANGALNILNEARRQTRAANIINLPTSGSAKNAV
ncbi:porphobilinogen deaminase-like isoform X2 [Paramacrobiotus metropolitanus]|nr:porphobilinogen deaminase-like isoform X2 [Paramacrobiotus metropolitanus]